MQRYPKQSYMNFTVTTSICFSFGLSCSAPIELPADTDISPTLTLPLGVTFKNLSFEKGKYDFSLHLISLDH